MAQQTTKDIYDNIQFWLDMACEADEQCRIKFADEGQREIFKQDLLLWKGFVLGVLEAQEGFERPSKELAELTKK